MTERAKIETTEDGYRLSRCEFCRTQIIWAERAPNPRARTKKPPAIVPIDPEPNDRGLLMLSRRGAQRPLVGEMGRNQAAGYRDAGGKTYIEHVKTCVKADDLRKKVRSRHA